MGFLNNIMHAISDTKKQAFTKEDAAALLKSTPEALEAFEKAYRMSEAELDNDPDKDFFQVNSREAAAMHKEVSTDACDMPEGIPYLEEIKTRIVNELLARTGSQYPAIPDTQMVAQQDLDKIPVNERPQLTGHLLKVDINETAWPMLVQQYQASKTENTQEKRQINYHMFRQGLDILDLDPVMYEILSMNQNAISNWLPKLQEAVADTGFFRIPETKVLKVPLPILQLTRQDYMGLSQATLDIVNRWAFEAFNLDENKTYFIKTGTYSSKFDFRNAKVTSPQEVRELGSYLLFIHHQACQMASPLSQPSIYGVSTTNEWCVREYIEDKEQNPCIYHGMPLHTEYRAFIDCDTDQVLAVAPYWDPDTMNDRFNNHADAGDPDKIHDAVIYKMHEETLMARFKENKDRIHDEIQKILLDLDLTGQWSLDVMQNGDDFWLIDMATASSSALKQYVPKGMLRTAEENWLPDLSRV